MATTLSIAGFGPIGSVEIPFADITVLVGPQATGKSLVLQWLKLAVDCNRILGTLGKHGFDVKGDIERLVGWMFGASYTDSIRDETVVALGSKRLDLRKLAKGRRRSEPHHCLYVPAHRALVFGTGFPLVFRSFDEETPFVVKDFSEQVRHYLSNRARGAVFPIDRRFRQAVRNNLDRALFHGGRVVVDSKGLSGQELRLVHGSTRLGIMEWTTGQREVLPLIVGLYEALPGGKIERREQLKWVIVEEPELGLHPDGILAVMLLLLETRRRGYRLVLSTHSSLVLDVLWALQHLKRRDNGIATFLRIFSLKNTSYTRRLATAVINSSQSITYLDFDGPKVTSRDITSLDPLSEDENEAGWGGLLLHSTRIADALADD